MPADVDDLERLKPTAVGFKYQDYPFYWVARVASVYAHPMEKALKREGLNVTGWRVGMILRQHGSLSISEISNHAAIKLSTVTRCVYQMRKRGWLAVNRSATDARVTEAQVTAEGLELITRLIDQTSRVINRAFQGLSSKDLTTVNTVLERVYANLSDDY